MYEYYEYDDYLMHYGVKGMKWGVRRYMNSDGSLTSAGQKRYGGSEVGRAKLAVRAAKKDYNDAFNAYNNKRHQAFSLSKKKRQANSDRFDNALNKADALNKAKSQLKDAKAVAKTEKMYSKQGKRQGMADFYKDKADSTQKKYDDTAKAFDKTAGRLDKEGKHLRAELSRRAAESIRNKGVKEAQQYRDTAELFMRSGDRMGKKASEFATKKNVNVGKNRVNALLKESRSRGYQNEKEAYEFQQELRKKRG